MDDSAIDHNLNQQHVNQPVGSVSRLGAFENECHELRTVNDSIKERFRQLKAATLRAGLSLRRRQMQNLIETGGASVGPMDDGNGSRGIHGGMESGGVRERNEERGKGCKRESSLLVAMALEMDSDVKKIVHDDGGSFYDCNICLYIAREPILTCCGHLFCWACFCKLPYVDSTAKECPVCEGEVTDSNIIPIYGNGDSTRESKLEAGMIIPPRPKARRVESVRQQRVARGMSHIPVAEALRRIRTSISAMGDSPQQEDSINDTITFGTNHIESIREVVQIRRLRSRQFSRVLSETAASLPSISSALNDAERLVEDLETYINDRQLQRNVAQFLSADDGDSLSRNVAISPLEQQISSEEIGSAVPGPSLVTTDVDNGIQQALNLTTNSASEINLPSLRFYSHSRRRFGSGRDFD